MTGSGTRNNKRPTPVNNNIQGQDYLDALLREIDASRRQELKKEIDASQPQKRPNKKKIKNPELEALRHMAITNLKKYSFFNTPQFAHQLRDIGPYKLDYCNNIKSHGTCNYGHLCKFYHGQNVEELKTAILAIINQNRKTRSTR
jgi:flagellar biosynthesis chaperone FliJ